MDIKFTGISLKNFCGIKELDTDLYDRTIIKGQNKSGKTTIKNAIYWVLYNKLADGSAPDGIRPHDEDGVDVDMIDINVTLTMDIDGKTVKISKTQKQNWVTDRTTQEQKFKGNVNEYEINDIPKKEKDFAEYMEQFIAPGLLALCTNPQVFLRQNSKERRATLFSMIEDADNEVIDTNPEFEVLKNELMDGTVEELILRSRKAVSVYKDKLKEIPARIDELTMQIQELTDDEKAELNAELAKADEQLAELNKQGEKVNAIREYISKAKIRMSEIATAAKLDAQKAEADAVMRKQTITGNIARYVSDLKTAQSTVEQAKAQIETHMLAIADYDRGIATEHNREFDEKSLSCPMCGRKYPDGKQESIRQHFEKEKADKIESLMSLIESTKELIASEKEKISKADEDVIRTKADIKLLEAELDKVTDGPVATADYTTDAEYLNLQADIAKWEVALSETSLVDTGAERVAITNRIAQIKLSLGREQTNDAYRARIAELQKEQLETSQKIADQEKMLDLLQRYQIAKVNNLTDKINSFFTVIKWQMFKPQINGGYQEVCIPTVSGTSYDGLLNHGDKLLAEIDLCQAFQRANNVKCPVLIDDTESLDEWRVPDVDTQLICIRRTDDKQLIVKPL